MKKMIAMFCCILLLCSMITGTAFASSPGDGNIDGGGGNMGSGTSSNKWTPGNDGVRITVVNAATGAPVSEAVDFSNKNQPGSVLHFGKVSKINYRNGSSLSLQAGGGYGCIKPTVAMPRIVGSSITPEEPAKVTFHIMGRDYTVQNIVIPEDDSQVVWVKWHTPDTPQTITITVSLSKGYTVKDTFVAKIVDLNEKIPPDPLATDTNPGYSIPALPGNPQKLTSNWGVWSCEWEADWQWHEDWQWHSGSHTSTCTADCTRSHGHWEDEGEWVDEGDWKYDYTGYAASISGRMSLMPDDIVPTASGKNMKSGYGVKTDVEATLSTTAPASHVTNPQTAFSVFPEFEYNTFLRLLLRASSGRNAKFTFKENEYSTYGRNVHFTPIWFPDHSSYTVYTQVWDCWTPDGMLSVNVNDYVSIQGSLFDDWYTNRE